MRTVTRLKIVKVPVKEVLPGDVITYMWLDEMMMYLVLSRKPQMWGTKWALRFSFLVTDSNGISHQKELIFDEESHFTGARGWIKVPRESKESIMLESDIDSTHEGT
jgi:hypothetical protein